MPWVRSSALLATRFCSWSWLDSTGTLAGPFPGAGCVVMSSMTLSSAHSRLPAFCRGSWLNANASPMSASSSDLGGTCSRAGICARKPISRNMSWLAWLPRSRLFSSSRQSCTMMPPSRAPSSRMMLNSRSNAPSNAAIFCTSSFARVSATSSSSASLRMTSRSIIMSISRTTPIGLARIASWRRYELEESSTVSSCTVW
mmetsp:Transcript_41094/g.104126  ORF Transcript_41094/g.104126 Transcript_41094/m.104126 type:complete len:200 (-) Transcript_41094:590-1189(-)